MTVVSGDADIYLHAGGQYEWDSGGTGCSGDGCGSALLTHIDGSTACNTTNPIRICLISLIFATSRLRRRCWTYLRREVDPEDEATAAVAARA